ncbi:MAG: acyl-CoA dehydrogenase family protein, partial [Oscillospiraceae bacterium]
MDYSMTAEQLELVKMVDEFGKKEIAPKIMELEHNDIYPQEIYDKLIEMGLHTMDIPEELGGGGMDIVTSAIVNETLSKYDAGIGVAIGANGLAYKVLGVAGTDEQKKLYCKLVEEGGFGAFCLTEPGAGSDASAVSTTAVKVGDEYVINGGKCFITNGGVANVYTVIASTDRTKGVKGLSAFLVERSRAGISIGKEEDKFGIRTCNTTDVIFEDVHIPAANLIGKEGEGFKIAMKTLDLSRPIVASGAVGVAQAALELATNYSKERITFGKPIAALQGIQFMLADMEIATETARRYARYACELIAKGAPHSKEAAIAKCYAGDAAMKVATDAVQILAGYGYMREYPAEKLMRDAKIFQI